MARSLSDVRRELRRLLIDMKMLSWVTGIGFDDAYTEARKKAAVLAKEYASLLKATASHGNRNR